MSFNLEKAEEERRRYREQLEKEGVADLERAKDHQYISEKIEKIRHRLESKTTQQKGADDFVSNSVGRIKEKAIKKSLPSEEVPKKSLLVYEGKWVTMIPEVITNCSLLSHGAFRLWVQLKSYCRRKGDEPSCFPSMDRLSENMGIRENQTRIYLKELKKVGLVEVRREVRRIGWGVINIYTLKDPEAWWKDKGRGLQRKS